MKDVEIIKARNVLSSRARTNLAKRLRVAAYCRVSTDSEDQLNSYKSQVQHYTDLIKSKSEWDLAGIYADEAITGTQVTKREDFQRLINDCMNGDVDMIITKSISRFARNTLDTLKYVRMLKEKGIAVFFEEENINTLTMDGELLLVILSSVAQQEVENISANVKKGLKMADIDPRKEHLLPYGYQNRKETTKVQNNKIKLLTISFLCMCLFTLLHTSITGISQHLSGIAVSIHLSAAIGATFMSFTMIGNISTKLLLKSKMAKKCIPKRPE